MHRIDLTSVYVLHTRPFNNTSLIVELFSKNHGRISVVARSARGPQSRYQGKLQLFTPMLAAWSGRHELKYLGNIELHAMPIQLNQKPLFCGFYLNELLMRLLHKEDSHPLLFEHYHHALSCLGKKDDLSVVLRLFEKKLLDELGYALPLTYEAKTQLKIHAENYYRFEQNQGFFQCDATDDSNVFFGKDLLFIAAEQFENERTCLAAKRLMRMALQSILGSRPLNSRELF